MNIFPIVKALRRHKAGVAIILIQIAITLAVVSNALFIIGERVHRLRRPTGMTESGLYLVTQTWIGAPDFNKPDGLNQLDAMQRADVAALKQVPGVISASAINSLPLVNASRIANVKTVHDSSDHNAAMYYADAEALKTLDLKIVEGRGFLPTEINGASPKGNAAFPVTIVTKDLAERLFPDGHALGQTVFINGQSAASTIVGIVERLQVPGLSSWFSNFAYNSILVPSRLDMGFTRYAFRADASARADIIERVKTALFNTNRMRVVEADGVQPFSAIRAAAYQADTSMAVLMGIVCTTLLGITAVGIFGLNSFWVSQRRKQIGLRRALGATRFDILKHFQTESFLISAVGGIGGLILSLYCNKLLMHYVEMDRLPWFYLLYGFLIVVTIGQLAAFLPSRRASVIEPIVATRV